MIPKTYRLKLNNQPFRGKRLYGEHIVVIQKTAPLPCWAVSISKKVLPHAVDRNRLRRQILNFLYSHKDQAKLAESLIIIKKPTPQIIEAISRLCLNSTDS